MGEFHVEVEERIKALSPIKYNVKIASEGKIDLPMLGHQLKRYEILYNPDIILLDKDSNEIKHLIELEERGDPSRELRYKLITFDFCLTMMKQHNKQFSNPKFMMIVLANISDKKKDKMKDRANYLLKYLKNIDNIAILFQEDLNNLEAICKSNII